MLVSAIIHKVPSLVSKSLKIIEHNDVMFSLLKDRSERVKFSLPIYLYSNLH